MKTMYKYFITLTVLSLWMVSCGDANSSKSNKGALSGNAAENLRNSVIDEVVVTDSIPLSEDIKKLKMVRQLTLSGMLSEAIRRVCNEESISAMFDN